MKELVDDIQKKNIEIDIEKFYLFPKEIKIVKFKTYYIVIYTEGIMWLILRNDEELAIYYELKNKKQIGYVLNKYSWDAAINVIMQIEAKNFEHPHKIENEEKNAYIFLTNNCNQRCRHCYMYAGDIKIEEMPYEKWFDVLHELKQAGFKGVTFTGGEITVYKGFELLIKYAHEEGLLVTVLSNGILWPRELVKELHGSIDEIQISIDGYDKSSYYNVRQYDGFEKALACVENFYKAGTKVSIAVTPLYENLDKFILNFETFAKLILNKYPNIFIKLNHELIAGRNIQIDEAKNREYKIKMKAIMEKLYPNYYIETFVLNYEDKAIRSNCGFGEISIAANGDVYWCNRIHELKSSINIFNTKISDIVRLGEEVKRNTSVDNTKGCKNCEVRYICGGGCRLKYEGIKDIDKHNGEWVYKCEGKENIYEKMVLSNEYFFEG